MVVEFHVNEQIADVSDYIDRIYRVSGLVERTNESWGRELTLCADVGLLFSVVLGPQKCYASQDCV